MKDYMKEHIANIDKIIKEGKDKNIKETIEDHLIKIKFFQHERLIHFLVTMLFALMFLMTFLFSINNMSLGIALLIIMQMVLLVPYIFYYYYLENSVQYMYKQYDKLKEIENKRGKK